MSAIQEFKNLIAGKTFVDDEVMRKAEDIGRELMGVTTTKMRQYFDDIKGLRRKIESDLSPQQIKVQLRLILSRVAYDTGRVKGKKDKTDYNNFCLLESFLKACIDKVIKSENIEKMTNEFITFIEAMYGYFYFHAK
ncbi:type III-A CRISPR-associated protein Csm2 [candidate division WOR-3 bacterium JGI_Cruoil_03_44_89]|uniref:CRISPR system Cms protein Csm2 n=1 Tax=candidate division WOR-3 bacterium JGI_Cruoil_03_44_89 TaxID=1973748 RepID=A0A235BNV4_UNCW3|nr:MAG: type III-A CRISPR-associated protein Csm2 [candidate division WOR-3 bacterium JGI_Cruoil_03_44_89]